MKRSSSRASAIFTISCLTTRRRLHCSTKKPSTSAKQCRIADSSTMTGASRSFPGIHHCRYQELMAGKSELQEAAWQKEKEEQDKRFEAIRDAMTDELEIIAAKHREGIYKFLEYAAL